MLSVFVLRNKYATKYISFSVHKGMQIIIKYCNVVNQMFRVSSWPNPCNMSKTNIIMERQSAYTRYLNQTISSRDFNKWGLSHTQTLLLLSN